MPELPDLYYIQKYLEPKIVGRTVVSTDVKQPIVLRVAVEGQVEHALRGSSIVGVQYRGPFLRFDFSNTLHLVCNLMLAGSVQHQLPKEKSAGHLCFSLLLDDNSRLNFSDEQKMMKAYVIKENDFDKIPKYLQQGVDILSSAFTVETFKELASKHSRKQVRVFINDHTVLSSIGNAYADEILFDAKIHPKTFLAKLSQQETEQLYHSILHVMRWGIEKVEEAARPIHIKVRDHMKVRNRKDQPCSRCGTKIRREGVRGLDVFFCPVCQPATRKLFIDWRSENREIDSSNH